MSSQDLSLLTDEEHALLAQWDNTDINGLHNSFTTLAESLIAARAENKRKDEVLRALADDMDTAENLMDEGREEESFDVLERVRQELRAMLQSEKGVPKKSRMETVEQSIVSSLLDVETELGGWPDGAHAALEELVALLKGALGKAEEYLEEQSEKGVDMPKVTKSGSVDFRRMAKEQP